MSQNIKNKIIEKSKELKIDKIGFADARPFLDDQDFFLNYQKSGFSSGFEVQDWRFRIYPELSLPGVKSIISIALAYPSQKLGDVTGIRGLFSRVSWGQDYHRVLKERLENLSHYIKDLVPESNNLIMVDTGSLSDRAVAVRAGLGWIGKNSNLITPEFGSFVFLGELLTTVALPVDQPLETDCGICSKCQQICPLGAIVPQGKIIDCRKCLAYQTINKDDLSPEVENEIGVQGYLYGCDLCQLVCPYNKNKNNDWQPEFQPEIELVKPDLEEFLQLSNRQFRKKFGHMSGSWRGKKVLNRNASLILKHHQRIIK